MTSQWFSPLAIATFVLASVAVWSILQTRSIQKNERKQSLLNEIIEWAKDTLECGSSALPKQELLNILELAKSESRLLLYRLAEVIDLESSFAHIMRRIPYIRKVAHGLKNDNLYKAVEQVYQLLQAHMDVLEELSNTVSKELDKFDETEYEKAVDKELKSLEGLRHSTQVLIEEATAIKVRLAG